MEKELDVQMTRPFPEQKISQLIDVHQAAFHPQFSSNIPDSACSLVDQSSSDFVGIEKPSVPPDRNGNTSQINQLS